MRRTYHISPKGNDKNDGSEGKPFRTIQRAADLLEGGETCLVHGGTYRESVRLTRSGTQDAPIVLAACPGEVVTLSGTEPVEGEWSRHEGSIWKTHTDREFEQLFAGGRMMIEARWPNATFEELLDRSRWANSGVGSRYGKMVDPELARTGVDWTGAVATLNVAHQFYTWARTVREHSAGSDTFTYDRDFPGITCFADRTTPWEHNRYYLSGKLEALDAPGEWFLDVATGTLYLWPLDGRDPNACTVEAKVRDYGLEGEGLRHVELRGLHFFGCTLRIEACESCTVAGCHLLFPTCTRRIPEMEAERSIAPRTLVSGAHNTVRDCSVAYTPCEGLAVLGSHNTVDNCLVHDCCWNGSLTYCGIKLSPRPGVEEEGRSVLRRCTVFDTGNVCVHVGHMPACVTEYCHIHDGGLACKDVSLLYTQLPVIDGTVFHHNWVHGCHAEHIALGIRGDDQTRGLTVHHNVVWDCDWDAIIVKGDRNRVHNNTCFANGGCDVLMVCTPEPKKPWREQWPLLEKQNEHSETFNNCARTIRGQRGDQAVPPTGAAANNYEGEDPALVDPEGFDFRPRADSPLVNAGRPVPGITDGEAPDVGAYEHAAEPWTAGCRNSLLVLAEGKGVKACLTMPPLRPVRFEVRPGGQALEFDAENWMHPQTVAMQEKGKVKFRVAGTGQAVALDLASLDPVSGAVRELEAGLR